MIKGIQKLLNEAGKIKIGRRGDVATSSKGNDFRKPERLDHFIITTTEKDEDGNFIPDIELMDRIKNGGRSVQNKNGDLIGIPIRLLYGDEDLDFPTRLASYVGGMLSCEGDGETAQRNLNGTMKEWKCPCERFNPDYGGKDKCKANGALTCVLDDAGFFGQVHKFRTAGINSVRGIMGGIELIQRATNGMIAGLPLMLVVNNKTTQIPGGGGFTTVPVVSICYRGGLDMLRNECLRLIRSESDFLLDRDMLQLENATVVDVLEEHDFVKEFYPNSIATEEPKEEAKPEAKKESAPSDPEPQKTPENPANPLATDNLFNETDPKKALAMVKKLGKPDLVFYLKTILGEDSEQLTGLTKKPQFLAVAEKFIMSPDFGTDDDSQEIDVKGMGNAEFLTIIESMDNQPEMLSLMRSRFYGHPINGHLSPVELYNLAGKLMGEENAAAEISEHIEKTDEERQEEEKNARAWDDTPPISEDQKKAIAILRGDIREKDKDFTNAQFLIAVSSYTDKDGNPLKTAKEMTRGQAEHFKTELENYKCAVSTF